MIVGHVSMHGAVLNSAAMKKFGISAATQTPEGGVILRKPGSNEPAGLVMEMAYLPVFASLPKPDAKQEVEWSRAGQMLYAASGITTAQEGATHAAELALMQRAAAGGADIIDVVAYPFFTDFDAVLATNPVEHLGQVRQSPEARRGEDHAGRFAAGQDGVVHDALPHRRTRRREGLARRAGRSGGGRSRPS